MNSQHTGLNGIAGLLAVAGFVLSGVAHASDYGCKVLLCLANPQGPTAAAGCAPPINQLWDDLEHARPFPSCEMSGDSHAQQGYSFYDPCPAGTQELADGVLAIQASAIPQNSNVWRDWVHQQSIFRGIGDGGNYMQGHFQYQSVLPPKVCVGNKVGTVHYESYYGGMYSNESFTGDVYENVIVMDSAASPRYIDVFVNNAPYRRVRW